MAGTVIEDVDTGDVCIHALRSGEGPPLLLLHGFPETHLMWRGVEPLLARRFTIVRADLPGYGRSGCPLPTADHSSSSKRAMARAMVAMMEQLGFPRFSVAGHDRGARVAYRLALDHPERVDRLAVLDALPTAEVWDRADARLATAFWPWSLLAQPAPLPERLIAAAPEAVVDDALEAWGSPPEAFEREVRAAYVDALRDLAHVHSICEEYRAASTLDHEHDQADRSASRRIACPVLALWSAGDALDTWYGEAGGPLGIWRAWADDVQGSAVEGGHFFPEVRPAEVAERLGLFLSELRGFASTHDHDQ